MATIAEELNAVLDSDFYGELAEQTIMTLYRAYGDADELLGSTFMAPEAHDIVPHVRRAYIEQGLRTQMNLIPGVVAQSETVSGGGNFFTKITNGKLTFTVSASDAAWCLPRHAEYRKGYATLQLPLFGKRPEPYDGPFCAIVTHGPTHGAAKSGSPIGFCQIGFPDHRYESFVHKVNLLRLYAPLYARLQAGEEIIIGQATAELRESTRRAKGAS